MPHRLELSIKEEGGLLCVEVEGQLAATTADRLKSEVDMAISVATRSVRAVILNCKRLDYVGGFGRHTVLALGWSLRVRGVGLLLVDLPPPLRVVFESRIFLELLRIYPTMDEARNSLS